MNYIGIFYKKVPNIGTGIYIVLYSYSPYRCIIYVLQSIYDKFKDSFIEGR